MIDICSFSSAVLTGKSYYIYVIVISQAPVGYHCYYTRPRAKPKVKC